MSDANHIPATPNSASPSSAASTPANPASITAPKSNGSHWVSWVIVVVLIGGIYGISQWSKITHKEPVTVRLMTDAEREEAKTPPEEIGFVLTCVESVPYAQIYRFVVWHKDHEIYFKPYMKFELDGRTVKVSFPLKKTNIEFSAYMEGRHGGWDTTLISNVLSFNH
jgi:hypothetical protein